MQEQTPSLGPVRRALATLGTPTIVVGCLPAWFALHGLGLPPLVCHLGLLGVMVGCLVALEFLLPNPRLAPRLKGTFWVAAFYNALITPLVAVLLPALVLVPFGHWISVQTGSGALWPDLPLWLDVLLAVLIVDFTSYWWHRLEHTGSWDWMWRLHSVHHAPPFYDVWMGAQVHPVDVAVFNLVGFTFVSVLGAPTLAVDAAAFFAAVVGGIHHLAADTRCGPLNWLVPFADHHLIHHSLLKEENGNFGNITTLFDQLFGSYIPPRPESPPPVGAWSLAEDYPHLDLGAQLRSPMGGAHWTPCKRPDLVPHAPKPPVLPFRQRRRLFAIGVGALLASAFAIWG